MTLTRNDWIQLRWPLSALVLVVASCAVLLFYVEQHKLQARQALQAQQAQLLQARQRYQTSGQEKDNIERYLPQYQRMIAAGFIGEERRIEWVDSLRSIHNQGKLFTISYSIGQQESYKPSFALNLGNFELKRSVMKLDLSMLHEGDLLTLLERLRTQQSTPFILRSCEVVRQAEVRANLLAPNMRASCELDWLTLREPQSLAGAP